MTAAGQLKIVAYSDLGQLGPKESEAVFYNWRLCYSISAYLLWIIPILALVLVKENRDLRVLAIIVPVLILYLLGSLLARLIPFPSMQGEMFGMVFRSLAAGVVLLFLLGHLIGNRKRYVSFLLGLAVMAVAGFTGAVACGITELSNEAASTAMLLGIMTLSILFGLTLAGWKCRKYYSPVRFMLWLAVWAAAVSIAAMLVMFLVAMVFQQGLRHAWLQVLIVVPISGTVLGTISYFIVLPFVLLATRSSFYYERLYGCFRLKSMPLPVVAEVGPAVGQSGVPAGENTDSPPGLD